MCICNCYYEITSFTNVLITAAIMGCAPLLGVVIGKLVFKGEQ